MLTGGLAGAAVVLAISQAIGVGMTGAAPRARVFADTPHSSPATPGRTDRAPAREKPAPAATHKPADDGPLVELKEPAVATAPPAAAPDTVAAAARGFVRDYYAALDGKDFAAAWQMLSPEVQQAFGGFAAWREGYARTISNAPGGVTVTPAAAGATVGLTLRAGDRGACGRIAERRFAVTWRLARTSAGWRATAASARKLSGPEPC
jgi:hypothetical protein